MKNQNPQTIETQNQVINFDDQMLMVESLIELEQEDFDMQMQLAEGMSEIEEEAFEDQAMMCEGFLL